MTVRDDLAFLRRREAEERALAESGSDDAVRQIHRDLADAYARHIAESEKAAD